MSFVTCHMSHVTWQMSPVACHLSITPTVTATDPPPAYSPTMHSRLILKDLKIIKKIQNTKKSQNGNKNKKTSRGMPILAIRSLTRSLQ